jgi:hypothetical protein
MPISPAAARRIVPWGRIVFGTVCVTAPDLALRSFLIKPEDNDDGHLLIRVFGSRAFVLGVLSAGLAGEEGARRALRAGALMDTFDISSMVLAYRSGRLGKAALVYNAGIGAVFASLGMIASADG